MEHKKQRTYSLTPKMSFRTGSLDQDVIVFCPVTGIIGKLEMPWLPVNLSYTHPLSKAGNALLLVRKYSKERAKATEGLERAVVTREALRAMFLELDRQVLAGCVLSMLQDKRLLRLEAETSMVERNLVLQNAGSDILCRLLFAIERYWENPTVWRRMPSLNVEYKAFSGDGDTVFGIAATIQSYTKILNDILNPHELTSDERAKIFSAQRKETLYSGRKIKVYSASAVQHKHIKESKTEAYDLLELLKPQLSIVLRTKLSRTIREMLTLPMETKDKVANELALAKLPEVADSSRKQLIGIIRASKTDRIFDELETLSQSESPRPARSIAEILATKQAKAEDQKEHAEEHSLVENELRMLIEGLDEEIDNEQE